MSKYSGVKTLDGLRRHGEYGAALGTVPGYLFQKKSGEPVFLETQKAFAQLNDYLCSLWELEARQKGSMEADPSFGAIRDQAIIHAQVGASDDEHGLSVQVADFCLQEMSFSLKDSIRIFNAASGLLLIYFLLIRTLKNIVFSADVRSAKKALDALGLDGNPRELYYPDSENKKYEKRWHKYKSIIADADEYKQRRGEPELSKYVRLLESNCGIAIASDINNNRKFKAQIKLVREIRNHFAHGDWDNLENLLIRVSAEQAFAQIQWLLSTIEDRYRGPVLCRCI